MVELRKYQLFINGEERARRGLDLAYNPFNGNVVGDVVLVCESLLHEELDETELTVRLFKDKELD